MRGIPTELRGLSNTGLNSKAIYIEEDGAAGCGSGLHTIFNRYPRWKIILTDASIISRVSSQL